MNTIVIKTAINQALAFGFSALYHAPHAFTTERFRMFINVKHKLGEEAEDLGYYWCY